MSANIDYSSVPSNILSDSDRERFRESVIYSHFRTLMSGVYHRFGIRSFKRLYKNGRIKADKRFKRVYGVTKGSIAYKNNYIALFDFESAGTENCINTFTTWQSFFFDVDPITIILRLERSCLPNIIRNPYVIDPETTNTCDHGNYYIPWVEAWHSTPIPLSAISGCFLSNNQDRLEFFEDMQEVKDIIG